jgi:hypothetical protein
MRTNIRPCVTAGALVPGANRRAYSPFPKVALPQGVQPTVLSSSMAGYCRHGVWAGADPCFVWHVQSYYRRPRMGLKELDRLAIPERTTRVWVGGDTAWMGADQLSQ